MNVMFAISHIHKKIFYSHVFPPDPSELGGHADSFQLALWPEHIIFNHENQDPYRTINPNCIVNEV